MKNILIVVLLLAWLPAQAQRGGGTLTLSNHAVSCASIGGVTPGQACVGPYTWCVDYSTDPALMYACNANTNGWLAVGSAGGGGGGNASFSTLGSGTANGKTFVVGPGSTLSFTNAGNVIASSVTCNDCVALGTETSGNYAAGDAEGGNATGLACTNCVDFATEVGTSFASSVLSGKLTDETGTGPAVFGTGPTISAPTINGFTASRCARFNSSGVLVPSSTGDCDSGDTGGGGGDGVLIDGTAVTDGTGVNFIGGTGVDFSFAAGPTPDTATLSLDATEVNDVTWGDGTDSSIAVEYATSTGTHPVWTYTGIAASMNLPLDVADQVTAPGNYEGIRDNDVNLTPDPTCANSGSVGELHILDSDESASDQWDVCNGTSLGFRFPTPDATATHAMFATATAGAGAYRAIVATDLPAITNNVTFSMASLATGDVAAARIPAASTITRVNCWVVGSSSPSVATVNVNIRAAATPTTTGTNVTTSSYTCDTTTINTSQTLNNTAITAGQWLYPTFGTVTGTVNLIVSVDFTTP